MPKTVRMKSVMTAFPYSIDAEAPISEVFATMDEHDIRHLPVVADHKLYGIISERDARNAKTLSDRLKTQVAVKDVCSTDPFSVDLNEPLFEVAEQMAEKRIGAVVITKEDRIAGIFTTTDACRHLARLLQQRNEISYEPEAV